MTTESKRAPSESFPTVSAFEWNEQRSAVALMLAEGRTQAETAAECACTDRTIRNWLQEPEFAAEVDRLSLMIGIASRAERLRIAQRVVREKMKNHRPSDRDLLDWLKFAQGETDGIKLDLAALAETAASMADSGPAHAAPSDGSSDGGQ